MSGWLRVVGLGPGKAEWLTPEANDVLHAASDIVGYFPYVQAVPETVTAVRHGSDNGVEVERARVALQMAADGKRVAIVSGGDAGIFGMGSALFEALEQGDPAWQELDIEIVPGMSAMLAAAARVGAPLGHDFCVISLSDYLKPWEVIEKRLRAACQGDFVIVIYNPASKTRKEQLVSATKFIRQMRGDDTIVIVASEVGRAGERIHVTTLDALDAVEVSMKTLLMIGSTATRHFGNFVYTPRYYKEMP